MRLAISLSAVLIVCMVRATYNLDCEQNQNGQSMSFFKTNGDLLLTGFFDVYDEKCSGPTSTGIHSMEMVATVVQILNSIHYIPGITLGLTLYEVCSYRSSDLQKALISFVVDKDCNNSTTPIAIYTTEDIRAKISPSIGLDIPIITAGPIIDVDIHAEAAVKFLIVNNIDVADVLVAQDLDVAQRFESVAKDNGLCLNRTVLAQNLGNLNDSSVVIVMTNKNIIKSIIESSSSVRVSHFIIIPLDGPLPPKPEQDIFEYPAHIFAIADSVHHSMKMHRQDYCTVISGESGSGKTKASKVIMKYIAAVTNLTGQQEVERVKNILIQSNIIFETFGNARTNRNEYSFRFGKYMDINFDFKGDPIGGRVINYLLEKSCVVQQ